MKTTEPGIEKIEGKRGTIYRVQIRRKGHKHQSRSFTAFTAAKKWKYDIINAQSSGEITDTATMRRTMLSQLIDRYIESELDPATTNYKTRRGHLQWWKEVYLQESKSYRSGKSDLFFITKKENPIYRTHFIQVFQKAGANADLGFKISPKIIQWSYASDMLYTFKLKIW